jgi:hypothetical protein
MRMNADPTAFLERAMRLDVAHGEDRGGFRIILRCMKRLLSMALICALVAIGAPAAPRAASRAPVRASKGMVGSADEAASRVGV